MNHVRQLAGSAGTEPCDIDGEGSGERRIAHQGQCAVIPESAGRVIRLQKRHSEIGAGDAVNKVCEQVRIEPDVQFLVLHKCKTTREEVVPVDTPSRIRYLELDVAGAQIQGTKRKQYQRPFETEPVTALLDD